MCLNDSKVILNKKNFKKNLDTGYEIEFRYKNKHYWILPWHNHIKEELHFYEDYTEGYVFKNFDEFIKNAKIGDEYLRDILDKLEDVFVC